MVREAFVSSTASRGSRDLCPGGLAWEGVSRRPLAVLPLSWHFLRHPCSGPGDRHVPHVLGSVGGLPVWHVQEALSWC